MGTIDLVSHLGNQGFIGNGLRGPAAGFAAAGCATASGCRPAAGAAWFGALALQQPGVVLSIPWNGQMQKTSPQRYLQARTKCFGVHPHKKLVHSPASKSSVRGEAAAPGAGRAFGWTNHSFLAEQKKPNLETLDLTASFEQVFSVAGLIFCWNL